MLRVTKILYICTMKHLFFILILALTTAACSLKSKERKAEPLSVARSEFRVPVVPRHISPDAVRDYMLEHYWDNFDFADTLRLASLDTMQMLRAYATYVGELVGPENGEPIRRLMQRAAISRPMTDYFAMLAERVLHDPNSPLRSDELYIPVLEALVASPHYDRYEKLAPEYDLRLASQNRVGRAANDILYTLADNNCHSLYDLKSDYTLIYFHNPGCAMCRDISAALQRSPLIAAMLKERRLTLLALYPDEDLEAWQSHSSEIPREWINAIDRGCTLRRTESYDLRAIPSLYLLDGEKRVVLKDCTDVGLVEHLLAQRVRL